MALWNNLSARLGIYRNTSEGWIAGVCAGIGERLHIHPIAIRLAFLLLGTVHHGFVAVLLYFILAFLLKPRAGAAASSSPAGVEMAYRDLADTVTSPFGSAPGRRVAELKNRFAALDGRLNNLEAAVMSDEISLRRKFRDLGA
jgi:phage shock protein C